LVEIMKLPQEKLLKLAEIASIAGIKEDDARALAKTYDTLIPSRKIGRVRLYPSQAAWILKEIADLSAKGCSPEEINARIGKDKAGLRAAKKGPGSERPEPAPETIEQVRPEPERSPLSVILPEREMNGLRETDALLATRIHNMTVRVETLEQECLHLRQELEERMVQIHDATTNLQKQMDAADEWISYFDMRFEGILQEEKTVHGLFRDWIAYIDRELETLKKPWWRR
jgi:DNA-binding transcriptional MerR regulator